MFANIPLDAVEPVADAAVADDDRLDPLAVLTSLIDKSLIRRTPDDRLEMLETIREFAAERLAARPNLETASRRAHAQFFTELCRRTSSGLDHGAVATPPTASLSSDLVNLELAWRYWTSQGALEALEQVLPALWAAYDATGRYRAMLGVTTDLLEVLESAPPTEERSMREVTLRTSQARALLAIDGYSPEVEAAYGRALAVFEGRRDHAQLYPVLRDLARFYIGGARIDKSIELGQELLRLGEAQDDDAIRLDGRFVIGSGLAMAGDLTGALEHLEIARRLRRRLPGPRRYRVGTDPRVSTLTTAAFLLWITGSPDTAVTYADRAVVVGRELDPFSRVYALFHSGILHFWRSEPLLMRERADAILEAVVDHDFPIWRALGACMLGAATVLLGNRPAASRPSTKAWSAIARCGRRRLLAVPALGLRGEPCLRGANEGGRGRPGRSARPHGRHRDDGAALPGAGRPRTRGRRCGPRSDVVREGTRHGARDAGADHDPGRDAVGAPARRARRA